jgi:endo-1,4-beta-mannosidase
MFGKCWYIVAEVLEAAGLQNAGTHMAVYMVSSQKLEAFINTTVRISNLTELRFLIMSVQISYFWNNSIWSCIRHLIDHCYLINRQYRKYLSSGCVTLV